MTEASNIKAALEFFDGRRPAKRATRERPKISHDLSLTHDDDQTMLAPGVRDAWTPAP